MNNVKEIPKVITPDPITETDEREEDQASPGSPEPPAYNEAIHLPPDVVDPNEVIGEEPVVEETTSNA